MISAIVPSRFRCDVIPERNRVRVAPTGELDLATAPQLEQTVRELLASGFDHVVLDLANLDFLDSTGLHLILSLHESAGARGYCLELTPGPPAVQRIFELTGTLERLPFAAPAAPLPRVWTWR